MAAIVEMFTGDRMLQLGREQYIRPMSIGYNWTKLRVGFRYSVLLSPNNTTTYIMMAYGLTCQSKQWFDASADLVYTLYSPGGDITSAPGFYINGGGAYAGNSNYNKVNNQTKVGAALNTSAVGTTIGSMPFCISIRGILICDFTRGSGVMNITSWAATGTPTDQTQANFLINMENETTPPFCSTSSMPAGNVTYGGTGLLDSLWFYWGNSIPVIQLSDIAVCRFY